MRLARMLQAVDVHAAGEPGRVIVGGVLDVPGNSMLEKARHLEQHGDELRRLMLREPRGYPALCANVILPPDAPRRPGGVRDHGARRVPGHVGLEHHLRGDRAARDGHAADDRAGDRARARGARRADPRPRRLRGRQGDGRDVPQRAGLRHASRRRQVEVPHLGTVTVDVAYGGMFYVIADADALGFRITPDEGRDITRVTEMIKAAAAEQLPVVHPEQPGFAGITIGQVSRPAARPAQLMAQRHHGLDARVPLGRPGDLDRRARPLAVRDGDAAPRWPSSTRRGGWRSARRSATRASSTRCSPAGWWRRRAWATGRRWSPRSPAPAGSTRFTSYVVDPTDPFPEGFTVGDIW